MEEVLSLVSNHLRDINNSLYSSFCSPLSVCMPVSCLLTQPLPVIAYIFQEVQSKEEQSVLTKQKRLNALKQTTKKLQQGLDELKAENQRKELERSNEAQSADAHTRREEEDAMVVTFQAPVDIVQYKNLSWCLLIKHYLAP